MAQIKIAEYVMTNGSNVLPTLEPSTVTVTTEDTVGDSTTTRILYCDETVLPTRMNFKDKRDLIEVNYIYASSLTDGWQMFMGCTNLTTIRADDWDVSHITTFNGFLMDCSSLRYFYANNWNVAGVSNGTQIWSFFNSCSSLTSVDLSTWTTPSNFPVTMGYCFQGCSKLVSVNLSGWSMNSHGSMFTNCSSLRTIIAKGISSTSANNLLTSLNSVTSGTVTISTVDDGEVDTSYATGLGWTVNIDAAMIIAKYKFTTGVDTLPTFNTGYTYVVSDTVNEDGTTTRTIINEQDIVPTSMNFSGATGLLEVFELDISGLTSLDDMFRQTSNCTAIHGIENWDTSKIKSLASTFRESGVTSIDLSKWDVSSVTTFYYMCAGSKLTSVDISNWIYNETTTSNIVFTGMFLRCTSLIEIIGIEKLPVHKTNSLQELFHNCSKMSSFNIKNWDVSNITKMYKTFARCNFNQDLSGWNTCKVRDYGLIFDGSGLENKENYWPKEIRLNSQ